MYYTIYKITNQINGKIYIGSHKTGNLNDNYMGSGKYLKRSIEKHGVENFSKEILYVFDTPEEMYSKEAELVNEDFIAECNTYNLKVGGFGGFDYINANPEIFLTKKRIDAMVENNKLRRAAWLHKYKTDESFREQNSKVLAKASSIAQTNNPNGTFFGKSHSEASKNKIGEANKILVGELNSQFGTMWIHNVPLNQNKKIKKTDEIPDGWVKGRRIKK